MFSSTNPRSLILDIRVKLSYILSVYKVNQDRLALYTLPMAAMCKILCENPSDVLNFLYYNYIRRTIVVVVSMYILRASFIKMEATVVETSTACKE